MYKIFKIDLIRILLCFTFIILTSFSFAQTSDYNEEINNLYKKIKNTEIVGAKIELYKDIIELSSENDIDNMYAYSKELLAFSENNNNIETKAYSHYYIGKFYLDNNNFEDAEKEYQKSIKIYEELANKDKIAQINNSLGLCYQYLNLYDKSLESYQNAIELFEIIGNVESAAVSYHDIGTLYNDIEKYSLALFYYEKAISVYEKFDNTERIAAIYQNIGVLHYNWGNLDQSIIFYQKSLKIYEKLKDKRCIAISLSNIGLVYEENKRYSKAREYYEKSLLMFEEVDNQQALVYIFYNLGSIYRNLDSYNKSIEYFNKGLSLSQKIKMKDYISYNYEALSGVYEVIGKNKKALNYYKDYIDVKDSIFDEERFNQIAELEAKFQNAQHQKEIEFLRLNQSIKDSELEKKEAQNMVLIFGSFLIFIIAIILFLFNRSQKRYSYKLNTEIKERKKSESELKILTDELEKRVQERTFDLKKANQNLQDEVDKHKLTSKNLEFAKNRAEESDKIKSSFLANISHEVRTPLNAILGFSQMFEQENLPVSKRRDYINKIKVGCKGLTNLIDDIIDFASIEAGEAKVEKKEFNPHPILEFLYDHYTNEILKQNKESLRLRFDNENTENDLVLYTDPVRLKQILSILLDNAIKFTQDGSIDFGFVHSGGNGDIEFYVKDTGIGIDKKHKESIFERFGQVEVGSTRNYGGTGIGLSVARSLIKMLDGEIWLESTLDVGSTFHIKLPFNGDEKLENKIFNPGAYNWKGKIILIAEDKQINYEILKETLSITEAELIWAKNGKEALDVVKSTEKIDLILMDIQMPIMNGYETTEKIKSIVSDIPIIAHTAYALPQDNIKCFESGCDDYIAKPISLNIFLNKLSKYLS
ncbi:MAG: tetratricopeptide repeat protein [Bacteroidales bacterium]|nr:tetratricopeptide repeat protein [Bacteroidales bacterium]